MNWHKRQFKTSWNNGESLMDQYSRGEKPLSSDHRKDPRSLVTPVGEFGGERRKGYPTGISSKDEERSDAEKNRDLPGESVLMDQDPPTGEGVRKDEFTARGEGTSDNDVLPIGTGSKELDRGKVGPHNMGTREIFKKVKHNIRGLNLI